MKTEKLPLVIGIGLPIILIVFVALTSYIPSLLIKPKYNFIYATEFNYDWDIQVINGKMSQTPKYNNPLNNYYKITSPKYLLYEVSQNKSVPKTLQEVEQYTLDPSSKSPDGFTVEANDSGSYSFFPFFYGAYNNGYYLRGKGLTRQVSDNTYNFKFVGWVTSE